VNTASAVLVPLLLVAHLLTPVPAQAQDAVQYRVLATSRTSTMQKELNDAAAAGFRFGAVMGGETTFGGSEVVVVMQKIVAAPQFEYRVLATNRTSTMQTELQQAADAGFRYVGQTVFKSRFGGSEVACILERDTTSERPERHEYRLLATSKTSTMQKELQEAGAQGFEMVGLTVGQTALGGTELVSILRRSAER
jgi:hypothetical protein